MILTDKLEKGTEYYFYAQNYFWSGFFVDLVDGNIHIKCGHLYFKDNNVYAYDEAFLDINQLIGFAGT